MINVNYGATLKRYLITLLTFLLAISAVQTRLYAAERIYYIAADEIEWDYAPSNQNLWTGKKFGEDANVFVQRTESRIGKKYLKAIYREYQDANFKTLKQRNKKWDHLGMLGPVIHAEVGDTIKIVFKNNASRPFTMHPHGVFYEKHSEGAPYADGTSGAAKQDDSVAPGKSHVYIWEVPERAGPGPNDPSSIGWLYHSHLNSVKDSNAGLVGPIIITERGKALKDGSPKDVDREFIVLFTVVDENKSWYLQKNVKKFTNPEKVDLKDKTFVESNLMHVINGYVYANLPGLEMKMNERARWYVMALGSGMDLHTPHWHGNTGLMSGNRVDVIELLPASMKVVDLTLDNPGIWMFHCHVDDHITAGMTSLYTVHKK